MWIQIKTNCRSKWYPTLTAGQQIDLDYDSAKLLIAEGLAFEIPPQASSGGGSGPTLQVSKVTLTQAQLEALSGTPIDLVPAPGAGKAIVPVSAAAHYKFGTTPYTITGGGSGIAVEYAGGGGEGALQWLIPDAGFIDQSADQFATSVMGSDSAVPLTQVENQPLTAFDANVYTLGDGTVDVTIFYMVVDVT